MKKYEINKAEIKKKESGGIRDCGVCGQEPDE